MHDLGSASWVCLRLTSVLAVSGLMQPGTSSMIQGLAACFTGLEDPRETSRCDHQLLDILVIAVCAVIACAESWEDIALYGRSKQAWLEQFAQAYAQKPEPEGRAVVIELDEMGHDLKKVRATLGLEGLGSCFRAAGGLGMRRS